MSYNNGTYAKVTLLKLGGAVVLIFGGLFLLGVFLENKNTENSQTNTNVSRDVVEATESTTQEGVDIENSDGCVDGSDCDDTDDREDKPHSAGLSQPPLTEAEVDVEFAIEEEGVPAVDEKPAKSN